MATLGGFAAQTTLELRMERKELDELEHVGSRIAAASPEPGRTPATDRCRACDSLIRNEPASRMSGTVTEQRQAVARERRKDRADLVSARMLST
jgi:hypothetical protein